MLEERAIVIGGLDCHSRTHHAVALDSRGQRLGDAQFPATIAGYQALHAWLEGFGAIEALGIESTFFLRRWPHALAHGPTDPRAGGEPAPQAHTQPQGEVRLC